MKFDFVIGNPPFNEDRYEDSEQKNFAPPVYHLFMDEAYTIADKVELIHPARFLSNAGNTPRQWNQKMLNDPHFKVLFYEENGKKIFPNNEIKGGIAITYRDEKKDFGAVGIFTQFSELNSILHKVHTDDFVSLSTIVITRTAYRLTDKMHEDHPEAINQLSAGHAHDMSTNIFERLPQIFFKEKPNDGYDYIKILGREENKRTYKYVRREYVNKVQNLDMYKIFLPKAIGIGALGEVLSQPTIANPGIGSTETFLSIGLFKNKNEVQAALKYIKTKFARVLLSVLKTTQDNTPSKWKYVPLQDFTPSSDIDWNASIADIDKQLYKKYHLSEEEITFIETKVKEME